MFSSFKKIHNLLIIWIAESIVIFAIVFTNALPPAEESEEDSQKGPDEKEILREYSLAARRQLNQISPEVRQKLIGVYGEIKEEIEK
jgi:hypothetical protein